MSQGVPPEAIKEAHKQRQDKGKMRWTERDLAVVRWIGEQYAVRLDQLAVLLARCGTVPTQTPGALGEDTVYRLVQRWKQAGVVERAVLVRQQPGWVWLTWEGLEQMELPYRVWRPKVQGLAHLYAVNQARLWVEHQYPTALWRSERQLNSERGFKRKQVRGPHRPDAEVEINGQRLAVEVERSAKARPLLAAILYELARTYASIWYFCSPTTQGELHRAIAELNPPAIRQKFSVVPLRLEGQRAHRPTVSPAPLHPPEAVTDA